MMEPFIAFSSVGAPLPRANINTDAIIPSAWLRSTGSDLARGLFAAWRFDKDGNEIADFVLNVAPFRTARLLFAGPNFGCGSSREAAAWALKRYGIGCVAAPSFADIFHENALRNGLLPAIISEASLASAIALIEANPHQQFRVDLEREVIAPLDAPVDAPALPFTIESYRREALLRGDDEIAATLRHGDAISAHAAADQAQRPWLYTPVAQGEAGRGESVA